MRLSHPVGVLDEHPHWSDRLRAELTRRGVPYEKIDPSAHAFVPAERRRPYAVVVNRVSPSSHTRGHGAALFYAHAYLAAPARPSSARPSAGPGPRGSRHPAPAVGAPTVSRAPRRASTVARTAAAAAAGKPAGSGAPGESLGLCPTEAPQLALRVERVEPGRFVVDAVLALTRQARIDVGGVEYLVNHADGQVYFYDVNATSNFVADAPALLGFDPTARFADYILAVAAGAGPLSARVEPAFVA